MYRIIYQNDRAIIQKNVSQPDWQPLWDNICIVFSAKDISRELWDILDDDLLDSLTWFLLDLDFPNSTGE